MTRPVSIAIALFFIGGLAFVALRDSGSGIETVASSPVVTTEADPGEAATTSTVSEDPAREPEAEASAPETAPDPPEALVNLGPAPTELVDIEAWLQTDATSLEELSSEVTIVKFWTHSCFNCKNTVPHFQEIYGKYKDRGLEIVGVHAPEFDFERDIAGIQEAANQQGITWPIAVDNTKQNFRSWQGSRRFWPRYFVIDQNGDIRYDKIGEGRYQRLDDIVAYLLDNPTRGHRSRGLLVATTHQTVEGALLSNGSSTVKLFPLQSLAG